MTTELPTLERWLDRQGLARHFVCSLPMIDSAIRDGMPYTEIFGRKKFRASEVESWLEATGRLVRRGDTVDTLLDTTKWPGSV